MKDEPQGSMGGWTEIKLCGPDGTGPLGKDWSDSESQGPRQLVPSGPRQTDNRMTVKNQEANLRIIRAGLAGLYFVYAGYLIYIIFEGFQTATQPNTIVPELIPTSVILAGFAAF